MFFNDINFVSDLKPDLVKQLSDHSALGAFPLSREGERGRKRERQIDESVCVLGATLVHSLVWSRLGIIISFVAARMINASSASAATTTTATASTAASGAASPVLALALRDSSWTWT